MVNDWFFLTCTIFILSSCFCWVRIWEVSRWWVVMVLHWKFIYRLCLSPSTNIVGPSIISIRYRIQQSFGIFPINCSNFVIYLRRNRLDGICRVTSSIVKFQSSVLFYYAKRWCRSFNWTYRTSCCMADVKTNKNSVHHCIVHYLFVYTVVQCCQLVWANKHGKQGLPFSIIINSSGLNKSIISR